MYLINPLLMGNSNIKPELIKSHELGYIYKSKNSIVRITAFALSLEQLISTEKENKENIPHYHNINDEVNINGFELELEQSIGYNFNIITNFSYLKPNNAKDESKVANTASLLGNIVLKYHLSNKLNVNIKYLYIGEQKREKLDKRSKLKENKTLDLTINLNQFIFSDVIVRLGIKNLFDYNVRYPAPLNKDLAGIPVPTYYEDLPRPGRLWWIKAEYKFY